MGQRHLACVYLCLTLFLLSGCESLSRPDTVTGTRLIPIESSAGSQREYWLHTPVANQDKALPLVIVLHGTGSNGERMLHLGGFVNHANTKGYVVAAPNSLGRAFNEGSGRIGEGHMNVDDVAFIETVIEDIKRRTDILPGQVFVSGFSSGGAMAQRIALESDANIAAIASVSGHLWAAEPDTVTPRPLLLMFGDSDPLNPVDGGPVRYRPDLVLDKPAHRVTAGEWARRFDCMTSVRKSMDVVTRRHWYGCRNDVPVVFLTVQNLGHYWPGGPVKKYENLPASVVGPWQGRVQATSLIWDFFRQSVTPSE